MHRNELLLHIRESRGEPVGTRLGHIQQGQSSDFVPLSRFPHRDKVATLSHPKQGQKTTPKGVSLSLAGMVRGRKAAMARAAVLPPPSRTVRA